MSYMFAKSKFNSDIADWGVGKVREFTDFSKESRFSKTPPEWDKEYYKISIMQSK